MKGRKFLGMGFALLVAALLLLSASVRVRAQTGPGNGNGQGPPQDKITHAERAAAAGRAFQQGALNPLMVEATFETTADVVAAELIDGAPHYFSHPNYANSPLPEVTAGASTLVGNPLQERAYATDNAANVFVVIPGALPDGFVESFQTWNQAERGGSFAPSAGLNFHAYVLRPTGAADEYTVVFDSGQLTVPQLADPAVSEVAEFLVANLAVQEGDRLAFYGQGVPLDIGAGSDGVYYPSPSGPSQGQTITLGSGGFPVLAQARSYSFAASVFDLSLASISGGMRKFVNELPGLGPNAA
ncbi:MAG: hypothetical protein RRC07_05430, partial [Anaerolineae bacterium]|nr:hypothetical protein [Anaerolineae bacterium]